MDFRQNNLKGEINYMKKLLCTLVCLAFMVGGAGCSGGNDGNAGTSESRNDTLTQDTQSSGGQSNFFLSEEPLTLKWASWDNFYAPASYNNGLEVWKTIEEKTNVKIEWEVMSSSLYDQQMEVRLAAGTDIPDIVMVPNSDPTPYGISGMFIPLNDLIKQNAPNIQALLDEYGANNWTSGDGKIYGISPVSLEPEASAPSFVLRKDWLDEKGLGLPNTLDEWLTVLDAFKQDVNGNGQKDEIPWISNPRTFSEAFGLQLWSGSDFIIENEKVVYQWTDPRMVDFLKFAGTLFQKGYISSNFGTKNMESQQTLVSQNRVGGFFMYPDWVVAWTKTIRDSLDKDALYVPVLPPIGANGERRIDKDPVMGSQFTSITKNCKNSAVAIKLIDYILGEEGSMLMTWGIEGKSYTLQDGKPVFTDFVLNNPDGLGPTDALRTLGSWPTVPWCAQLGVVDQMLSVNAEWKGYQESIKPYSKVAFPGILATNEEQAQIDQLSLDIQTYQSEMLIKFIRGTVPISDFDSYVAKLKSMNLDELVKVKQAQYDRYKQLK